MGITVLIGGARSGKSHLAMRIAEAGRGPVTFVATGEARDEEMAARIAQHRRERPPGWTTLEEPLDLVTALTAIDDRHVVVLDCLTLWVANCVEAGWSDDDLEIEAAKVAAALAGRIRPSVVVTNEVGAGIVPTDHGLSRRYRDLVGTVNGCFAREASQVLLVVAGRVLALDPADALVADAES